MFTTAENPSILTQFFRILRRRIGTLLVVSLIVSALMTAAVSRLTPEYEATAVVVIDGRTSNAIEGDKQQPRETVELPELRSKLDTISNGLVGRVVDQLSLELDPEFNPALRPEPEPSLRDGYGYFGKFVKQFKEFVRSKTGQQLYAESIRTEVIKNVGQKLNVRNDGRSYTIEIKFTSVNALKAARIADSFAKAFLDEQLATRREQSLSAAAWLGTQVEELRQVLRKSEQAVQDYRTSITKNTALRGGGLGMSQQLADYRRQLVTARVSRSEAESRLAQAQSVGGSQSTSDSVPEVLRSELISRLRERETDARRREADLLRQLGPRHPDLIGVRIDLRNIREKINEEIRWVLASLNNNVAAARIMENDLEAQIRTLENQLTEAMQADLRLQELDREAKANRSVYEAYLARWIEIDARLNAGLPGAKIISDSDTLAQLKTVSAKNLVTLIALIALLLGTVAALIRDLIDRSLRAPREVEAFTGLPAIGLIPTIRPRNKHAYGTYVLDHPDSLFTEALRSLSSALNGSSQVIMPLIVSVTSSVPEEGKTMVTLSLAQLLSAGGHKVLLIDGDLRRPKLARSLNAEARGDFLKLLRNERPLHELVQVHQRSGLHCIFAESRSSIDPTSVFSISMMARLKFYVKEYDIVLIDTPPISIAVDAGEISRYSDLSLFVVRWGHTPREVVASGLHQLGRYTDRIAGIVLTRMNVRTQARFDGGATRYSYRRRRNQQLLKPS